MNQIVIQNQELNKQNRKQAILERAQKIAEEGKGTKIGMNHWRVQSSSEKMPGFMYDITFDRTLEMLTCSCPHFEHRLEYCKHILSVALFEGGVGGE